MMNFSILRGLLSFATVTERGLHLRLAWKNPMETFALALYDSISGTTKGKATKGGRQILASF